MTRTSELPADDLSGTHPTGRAEAQHVRMGDEAIDALRAVVTCASCGRRPQRVTVRAWLAALRKRGAASAFGRTPMAWRISTAGRDTVLTDDPRVVATWAAVGYDIEPLYTS